jgi:hypothetical protein
MSPRASILLAAAACAAALTAAPAHAQVADTTPPAIDVTVPAEGQVFASDQGNVPTNFACHDEIGGSGLASCVGPAFIDTTQVGDQLFTVTATDRAGNSAPKLVHDRVVDPVAVFDPDLDHNTQAVLNAAVRALKGLAHASSATIATTVRPGSNVAVRVTGRRGATAAKGSGRAGADGTVRFALRVKARRLLRGRLHVFVTVANGRVARRSKVIGVHR